MPTSGEVRTPGPGPGPQELGSWEPCGTCSEGKPWAHAGLLFYSPSHETRTHSPLLRSPCPERAAPGSLEDRQMDGACRLDTTTPQSGGEGVGAQSLVLNRRRTSVLKAKAASVLES